MVKNFDESKSPSSNEGALAKLRQRLKEKESALEVGSPTLWFVQFKNKYILTFSSFHRELLMRNLLLLRRRTMKFTSCI